MWCSTYAIRMPIVPMTTQIIKGKMYYDERYKSFNLKSDIQNEIEKHIRKTDMMSVQDVKGDAPYLQHVRIADTHSHLFPLTKRLT